MLIVEVMESTMKLATMRSAMRSKMKSTISREQWLLRQRRVVRREQRFYNLDCFKSFFPGDFQMFFLQVIAADGEMRASKALRNVSDIVMMIIMRMTILRMVMRMMMMVILMMR